MNPFSCVIGWGRVGGVTLTVWIAAAIWVTPVVAQPDVMEGSDVGEPAWAVGESPLAVSPLSRHGTPTQRYDHGEPTAFEQSMLELVNRARTNPGAEAARLGIALNQGLDPGTIADTPKPPLAFNPELITAARVHSQWMLDTDTFSHTGANGSSPGDRMQAAGYLFSGSWTWGENISWRGTTGTPNLEAFVGEMHDGLFRSPGHRRNLCNAGFDEVGIGLLEGVFTSSGRDWNAAMGTQNFARSASTPAPLLVGVVFEDANKNGIYDPGEGMPGVTVMPASGTWYALTSASGGYALPYASGGAISYSGGGLTRSYSAQFIDTGANVKLDLELGSMATGGFVESSVDWSPAEGFRAQVEGTPGTILTLEVSEDLQSWTDVASITLEPGAVAISHPGSEGGSTAFYRLRQGP
jgi:uncharacterized protein YkwD